ncbi:Hypothetical protein HVR_LOCUS71 [uncultured virus]|nr:Hypothetical protein HVR_LOCUS71 [uncultured virus]
MRVIGSITTIPGRYPKLLRTLKSLRIQDYPLDAIYLGISEKSRRLQQPYPELPDEIRQLCTVVPCEHDYGPCTKIVGGLLSEDDPNTIIFTFDDDVIYGPTLVSNMLRQHAKHPQSAIGSSGILFKYGFPFYSTIDNTQNNWNQMTGFHLTEDGRSVDVLCGFSSILYLRGFFPIKSELYDKFLKYPLIDKDVYFNDDIMISAFLSKSGIERRVVPDIPVVNEGKVHDPNIDSPDGNEISFDKLAFIQRFRRSINKTKEWGFFRETQPVAMDETIGGHIAIVVIFLLLLLVVILLFFSIKL